MGRIRKSGGYRNLRTFQASTIIYDATYWFCEKFLPRTSRTIDQMVQAARSGRQNIAEGSRAGATSSQTELRLVNVARSSLEELLLDYEDFIRHRRQRQWEPDAPEALEVRRVVQEHREAWPRMNDGQRYDLFSRWLENDDPFIRANALICLINQTNYLLDQQIDYLEEQFITGGGYSENLAAHRLEHRAKNLQTDPLPTCPKCNRPMVLRTTRRNGEEGSQFLGCSAYPVCKGTRNLPQ